MNDYNGPNKPPSDMVDASSPENNDNEGNLKKLPNATVKLITSSQVITSVFSVVKELIENSLDAKATSVDIKLDNCGFDRIEVRDNGTGIKSVDTKYMAQPHYTSKITNTEDLEMLNTYGFRGEALGSLCSLADVSITTKTVDDPVSMTYALSHEGKVVDTKPSHLAQGTTVTVTNLFRNLPVRRQFYSNKKKQKEELKRVEDVVIAFAVICYDVRFCLKHNNNIIWQKQPLANVKSALINVFGVSVMMNMEQLKRKCLETEVEIEVFLPKVSAPPDVITRHSGDRLFCYINKRTVVMKDVEKLVRKYYLSISGADSARYPMGFLHIMLPYKEVDVNLDPNKTLVILQEKEKVFKFLNAVLEEMYGSKENKPSESKRDTVKTSHPGPESNTGDKINRGNTCLSQTESPENSSGEVSHLVKDDEDTRGSLGNPDPDETNPELDLDFSDVHLTEELLKEFEDYRQTDFDISTPESNKSVFKPVYTSTQAEGGSYSTNEDVGEELRKNSEGNDVSRDDDAALKWALGTAVRTGDGKIVEPVQVIKGIQAADNSPRLEVEQESSETSTKPCGNTTVMKSKLLSSLNQSSLFDVSVKKPPSGYVYFSKEVRRKVITENRGASFAEIAAILVEKWKALSEDEKKKYEDLAGREVQWNKYTKEGKEFKRPSDDSQTLGPSAKKCKINKDKSQDGVQKLFMSVAAKCKQQTILVRDEKIIKFSLSNLKKTLSEDLPLSQSQIAPKSLILVGQLLSQGAWVCCHDNCLKLFQPIRAKEELIYRRLMASHKFPTEPLDTPELLTKEFLHPNLWQTLLSLKMSVIKPTDPYCYINDARIVNNGFRIQHQTDPVTKQPIIQLIAMTTDISGLDKKVLVEILMMIKRNYSVSLSDCRPVIIKHYLQGEAVRMSRQLPPQMCFEDVQDLITDLQCHLSGGTKTCFHGKPILLDFYDLTQLPESQQNDSTVD